MLCSQRAHDGTIEEVDTMKTKPVGDFRPYLGTFLQNYALKEASNIYPVL